jgi:hypothetical protein
MSMLHGKHHAALAPATTNAAIAATIIASLACGTRTALPETRAARMHLLGTITLDSFFGTAQ